MRDLFLDIFSIIASYSFLVCFVLIVLRYINLKDDWVFCITLATASFLLGIAQVVFIFTNSKPIEYIILSVICGVTAYNSYKKYKILYRQSKATRKRRKAQRKKEKIQKLSQKPH